MLSLTLVSHGGVISPFNAFLVSRGIATLPIRMAAHSTNATELADWLSMQPGVQRVIFPFSESHPQHELARRQMAMSGGMISFQVEGGEEGANAMAARMMKGLNVIHYAVSLGHHRSLMYFLSTKDLAERSGSSYALQGAQLEEYRAIAGDGVFRFSVGLEDTEDLKRDLAQVLY